MVRGETGRQLRGSPHPPILAGEYPGAVSALGIGHPDTDRGSPFHIVQENRPMLEWCGSPSADALDETLKSSIFALAADDDFDDEDLDEDDGLDDEDDVDFEDDDDLDDDDDDDDDLDDDDLDDDDDDDDDEDDDEFESLDDLEDDFDDTGDDPDA